METLLLLCLMVALVIRWIYLRDRLNEMDRRINALASAVYAQPKAVRETVSRQAPAEPVAAPPVTAPVANTLPSTLLLILIIRTILGLVSLLGRELVAFLFR